MNIISFLQKIPKEKQPLYQGVYNEANKNITNNNLAIKLGTSLTQIEQIRRDLVVDGLIRPKRIPYRKQAGLAPVRKIKPQQKKVGTSLTAGLREGYIRHMFAIHQENLQNIRLLSRFDHKNLNEFLDDLLTAYFLKRKSDLDSAINNRDRGRNIFQFNS